MFLSDTKNIFKILLFSILMFSLTACPDDPVKVEPDPCEGKTPVTADFDIYFNGYDKIKKIYFNYYTDTILVWDRVTFEAKGDYEYYEWQLGDDPTIYNEKTEIFQFKEAWGELKMRLIVKNPPDTLCFPDDDGIDTVYKTITVIDRDSAAIIGSYIGYHTSDTLDTFIVDVKYEGMDRGLVFYNINRGFHLPDHFNGNIVQINWLNKFAMMKGDYTYGFGCQSPDGYAELQEDNKTLIVNYEAGPYDDRKEYTFIGVKQ